MHNIIVNHNAVNSSAEHRENEYFSCIKAVSIFNAPSSNDIIISARDWSIELIY